MKIGERFAGFFSAVNGGRGPYRWQRRLVEHVATTGRWPDIAAPTGSGKSSVIDAHVFLVAEHSAGRLAVRPPRRLVLVAPRRVLVDDQFDRATRLSRLLHDAADEPDGSLAGEAARALKRLVTSEGGTAPLAVWRLRGGVLLENGWRLEPAACQVLCATPQMWGSRLLLRGYRASRESRNLEAGMLGQDTVAVIDEAHLHERLVDTARNVASRSPAAMGLQVVAMSATRPAAAGQAGLSDADLLKDVGLAGRVRAPKTVEVIEVADWRKEAATAVVERARQANGGGTVGVFVNDVAMALEVSAALAEGGKWTVELVCGRLRLADVSRLRARRPGLLTPTGDGEVAFLVSTQSLEVGVDLDLPVMVTTIAPAAALAQRAGRLNRTGRFPGSTFAVVSLDGLSAADPAKLKGQFGPYEPPELVAAARWLDSLGHGISPEAVMASSLPLPERPSLPALRSVDLETLAMTSDIQAADPEPVLYLEEPEAAVAEVGVIARRHLELEAEVIQAALLACPARPHEVATMRLGKALNRVVATVLAGAVPPWVLRARDGALDARPLGDPDRLGPGDTLVVPHGAPICTSGVVGLGEAKGPAGTLDDVLEDVPKGGPFDQVVPLPTTAVEPHAAQDTSLGSRASRSALAAVLDDVQLSQLARRLRTHRRLTDLELTWCGGESATGLLVVRDLRRRVEQTPRAAAEEAVTVDAHQAAVERRLRALLDVLQPEGLGADTGQLALAARTHDEGKRHPRFQRRMGAGDVALAKPLPGHVPDRGDGWRHEQLSAAYAAQASDGDPLVITLVAGHHGRGRPVFDRAASDLLDGWNGCPDDARTWVERLFGARGRYELERTRVQRQLGVHRLAFLEGLLRCADMQVSREGG